MAGRAWGRADPPQDADNRYLVQEQKDIMQGSLWMHMFVIIFEAKPFSWMRFWDLFYTPTGLLFSIVIAVKQWQ
jgi:hypothetical protein